MRYPLGTIVKMKLSTSILFIVILICTSCKSKSDQLKDIYKQIRNSPQSTSIDNSDKKLSGIKKLRKLNDESTPDSLMAIFYDLDPTLNDVYKYQYEILDVLREINTEKSFKVYAKIIGKTPLGFPGNMFFIWQLKSNPTENIKHLFPEISDGLKIQKWIQGDILRIILTGCEKKFLSSGDLISSKDNLIWFYNKLLIERDSLPGTQYYRSYYTTHLPNLIECLSIYDNDPKLNIIYYESLKDNIDYKYVSIEGADDNEDLTVQKLDIVLQASIALLKNDNEVDPKYVYRLVSDPVFRLNFYKGLEKANKLKYFPIDYLNQDYFAESVLMFFLTNNPESSAPNKLKLIKRVTINSGENKGAYFFFDAGEGWNDSTHIRIECSGPQPLDPKRVSTEGKHTGAYVGEAKTSEIDQTIQKFIDGLDN